MKQNDTSMLEQQDLITSRIQDCVALIQKVVHVIRSTEEFAVVPCTKRSRPPPLKDVDILARCKHLIPRIQECCDVVELSLRTDGDTPDPRYGVVSSILWPLITCLGRCYAVLDEMQPKTVSQAPGGKRNQKPPPPPGLLSIHNYTDIAALMEFLVCTSILPLLQQDILPTAQERARHLLPKSLAGRIPRSSLEWGCAVQNASSDTTGAHAIMELRTTVVAMGRLILLDRFRPMLLPRHLADLYAAIFQADALEARWKQSKKETSITAPPHYSDTLKLFLSDNSKSVRVDPYSQARAYQTLLLRGTKAPLWMRQRVSILLTDLACHDLAAIVHVFVRSVSFDDMTGASLRLARALTSVSTKSRDSYIEALCQQLLVLLDAQGGIPLDASLDPGRRAAQLTVWAVFEQLPLEALMKYFLPSIYKDLLPYESSDSGAHSVHKAVRRVSLLLAAVPASHNPWKLSRVLLSPAQLSAENSRGTKVTILGQLLRIACIESAVVCNVKNDALYTLRQLVGTLVQSTFPNGDQGTARGVDLAALMLLYSIPPTALDVEGYRYTIPVGLDLESDLHQPVTLEQIGTLARDIQNDVADIERMAKLVVGDLLLSLAIQPEDEAESDKANSPDKTFNLSSTMFHLLLLCYFSEIAPEQLPADSDRSRFGLPSVYQEDRMHLQLTVMLLLPLLCEQCSPESLLLTDGSGVGILSMVKLILECTSSIHGDELIPDDEQGAEHDAHEASTPKTDEDDEQLPPFCVCSEFLGEILSLDIHGGNDTQKEGLCLPLDEALISTSSIVLTLMVAILELGSQHRCDEEERILRSMMPSLATLSRFRERGSRTQQDSSSIPPELAEMAAHAMALIAARSQLSSTCTNPVNHRRSTQQILVDTIKVAEKDLESEYPPIRARGVVSLARVAQRYSREKETCLLERPMIAEIDQSIESDDDDLRVALSEIVRVSVVALADAESYVYLAAIQTIVAAADVSPREVVPSIARGICSGVMSFPDSSTQEPLKMIELFLSTEQRVKLTEAMLFTIRRRGKAINEYVPLLMSLILYGIPQKMGVDQTPDLEARMYDKTHQYFVAGNELLQDGGESLDFCREEMDIRVRTGGPVFQLEENDVLRAGCISVLCELVSASLPAVVARYCGTLMHFATNALNLEVSRPVRRAAALLCSELYGAILLEQEGAAAPSSSRPFNYCADNALTVEMVSSDEEALHVALRRCVDINDAIEPVAPTSPVIAGKVRFRDPATDKRCEEALDAREEAVRRGVLATAYLHVAASKEEDDRLVCLVRARLNEN